MELASFISRQPEESSGKLQTCPARINTRRAGEAVRTNSAYAVVRDMHLSPHTFCCVGKAGDSIYTADLRKERNR